MNATSILLVYVTYKWFWIIYAYFSLIFTGTIPALVNLLKSPQIKLQYKTVGLLSNISTHVSIVHAIVEAGGIPAVINLLTSDEPELHSRCAIILYDVAKCENKDVIAKYVSTVL